jgi:nucleotide-binding universal stress UspA family protein
MSAQAPTSGSETDETDDEEACIVAAISGSEASRVLELAARLARRGWSRAALHVVHVFRTGAMDRAPAGGERGEELADEARLFLAHHVRMASRQCSCPVTGHFTIGAPTREIMRIARAVDASVIVVGRVERMMLGRLLMGSSRRGVDR